MAKSSTRHHLVWTGLFFSSLYGGSAFSYDFRVESMSVYGNLPEIYIDEFNDGVLAPWIEHDPTVVEAGGHVTFSPPGGRLEEDWGSATGKFEESSIFNANAGTRVVNGQGDFTAVAVLSSGIPGENEYFFVDLVDPNLQTDEDWIVSLNIHNLTADIAGAAGLPSGFAVSMNSSQLGDFVAAASLDPSQVTGDIHLILEYDDSTDEFSGSVSLDGGVTIAATLGSLAVTWTEAEWNLGGGSVVIVLKPPTQEEINEAMRDISTTPNTASTASVISIACPATNEEKPNSQFTHDCNVLVGGALAPDIRVNAEASVALSAITANQATVPLSSSRSSLSTQIQNLSTRLAALRGGATGIDLRGLSISAAGQYGTGDALAGFTPSFGGAASADEGSLFFLADGRLGVFVNGTISTGDKDRTTNEDGFDFDGWGITAGVDYRFRDDLVAGIAGGYNKSSTDIDNNGGNLDTDGYSISLYGTYFQGEHAYVDAVLTYGSNDYDQDRNIRYGIGNESVNQTASADYDGDQWSGAIGIGYDIPKGPWTFGPVVRLQYLSANLDGYDERMSSPGTSGGGWAARLDDVDQKSFTTTIGGNVSRAFGTTWGVLLPQLHLSWVHEFEDDAIFVNGSFIQDPTNGVFGIRSDRPDSDYFNARLALSAQLAQGNSAFLYYNKVFGYRDLDVDTFGAGVRLEF